MRNAKELHQLLTDKAKELDLPKAFHRDLETHDLTALQNASDDQTMLWGIGECGTHMIALKRHESPHSYIRGIGSMEHWFLIRDGRLIDVKTA